MDSIFKNPATAGFFVLRKENPSFFVIRKRSKGFRDFSLCFEVTVSNIYLNQQARGTTNK